eukprot:15448752-Alexandrium_andersonii.AAC.1
MPGRCMAGSSGPDAISARARLCVLSMCPSSASGVVSATRPMSARLALAATPGLSSASWSLWAGPSVAGAARFGSL